MTQAPLLDLGLGLVGGWAQGYAASGQAKAANTIREANNSVERGKARLASQMQALNNNRILARAGAQADSMTRSVLRTQRAQTRQGFEQSIAQAEQIGAAAASAAARGQSATALNAAASVAEMSAARQRQYLLDQGEDATYEQLNQLTYVMGDATRSLGSTYYMPAQDFTQNVAGSWSDYLLGALAGKQNTLQTALGQIGQPRTANPNIGPPWLSPWAGVSEAPTLPSATTFPVAPQTNLVGTPLQNITIN